MQVVYCMASAEKQSITVASDDEFLDAPLSSPDKPRYTCGD